MNSTQRLREDSFLQSLLRRDKPKPSWSTRMQRSVWAVFLESRLNVILVFLPLAVISNVLKKDAMTFVFSMLALVPLAERLGFVTEVLAAHTNDALGGLLNATFGNATELIVCAVSLQKAGREHDTVFLRLVQLSLLGSILSNLLLVLGSALFVGGLKREKQSFNREGMGVNSGMLFVAVVAVIMPSTISRTHTTRDSDSALHLSRYASIIMLVLYSVYLIFQLVTHKHLYEQPTETEESRQRSPERDQTQDVPTTSNEVEAEQSRDLRHVQTWSTTRWQRPFTRSVAGYTVPPDLIRAKSLVNITSLNIPLAELEEDSEEDMSIGWALFWLVIITALIAFLSEMVVGTIEDAHDSLGIPMPFLATIVLPIVGNAAEHASAILFAFKDRMEITLAVAVGSATQIAVLVIPFTVILAWIMGQPLGLDFEWFEAFTLFTCTVVMVAAVNDGTSQWIKGLLLVVAYLIVAGAFWVHSDKHLSDRSNVSAK